MTSPFDTAKKAVKDKSPDIQVYKEVHQLDSDVMASLRLAGRVLACSPKVVDLWGKLERARSAAPRVGRPPAECHQFEWNHFRKKWVCNKCRRTKRTTRVAVDRKMYTH